MQILWCWRCKCEVPMLDRDEWARVHHLLQQGMRATKDFRREHNLPLEGPDIAARFQPALNEYERITGYRETNHVALYHHHSWVWGPPCKNCGKVLRTPVASKCFECGTPA